MDIEPKIKPLIASLLRIKIRRYLASDEFKYLLIENDIDKIYEKRVSSIRGSRIFATFGGFPSGEIEEEVFIEFLSYFYNKDINYFFHILYVVLIDFHKWSKINVNYDDIFLNLLKVGILDDNINKLKKELKNISKKQNYNITSKLFVDNTRIEELKSIKSSKYDLTKLIGFCEELNIAYSYNCYLTTVIIVRSIIDHVPPIFGKNSFPEVTNNTGSKSFKESMKILNDTSRKIADSHLHTHIRKKEVLPNKNQVDFSHNLDVLLGEIYRILK